MGNRVDFQRMLEGLTPNVYYQPPSSISIRYPSIVYSKRGVKNLKANNMNHVQRQAYSVTVMDKNPDSPIAAALHNLPYCTYDRSYVNEGLNHDVFVIYY